MTNNESKQDLATVQAISALGSLSYVCSLITDKDSATYVYTQLCLVGKKLRDNHDLGKKKEDAKLVDKHPKN